MFIAVSMMCFSCTRCRRDKAQDSKQGGVSMSQANHADYVREYELEAWGETPFVEFRAENYASEEHRESYDGARSGETNGAVPGHFETPFEAPQAFEAAAGAVAAPEVAAVAELSSELKDHAF